MAQRLGGEAVGCFFLFATVIGSGIMAERLAGGNVAMTLLCNTLATGAILFVLITILGPISGAHFNPVVTMVARLCGEIEAGSALLYITAQLAGGVLGVWASHAMFDLAIIQLSERIRTGPGQWIGEGVATFGLVFTILGTSKSRPRMAPATVALYICAAYWFTSSTSFANPAITIARSMSNSFAGISPLSLFGFIASQFLGALLAYQAGKALFANAPAE
ncbi:MAG: MIP/aquaporin family protein [Novosphingobium sp.]